MSSMASHGFQWLGLAPRRRGPSPNSQRRCGGVLFLSPIDRDILLVKINTKMYQNDNPPISFFSTWRIDRDIRIYSRGGSGLDFSKDWVLFRSPGWQNKLEKTHLRKNTITMRVRLKIGPRCGAWHPISCFWKAISPPCIWIAKNPMVTLL